MLEKITDFAGSLNFSNALKVTIAALIPFMGCALAGDFDSGFALSIGVLLTYPGDIPSNRKHKINGIIVAAFIVATANLVINLVYPYQYLFYLVYASLVFFLALISVYGHRATMISFSGLLSASLAPAHIQEGWNMLTYSGLVFAGGLFYLLVSMLFDLMRPHKYISIQIADCIRLTSKYMKLRGDLWNPIADKKKIIEKQLELQVEINTIHENLREILIRNRSAAGTSNENRKMLLVFIYSVEVLELALSTSFDHNRLHQKFKDNPTVLHTYQVLAYNLANTLKRISKSIAKRRPYVRKGGLKADLEKLEEAIRNYSILSGNITDEGVLMLGNMLHYAEKQVEKIRIIERAFGENPDLKELKGKDRELEKFLAPHYYPISTLTQNLGFKSAIFRHSLRLTVTLFSALLISGWFHLQNSYWILLTIVVIMRPGFGLTKQRSQDRIIGTVAGGIAAFALLMVITNDVAIGIFAILFMLFGYAFVQINYKLSAAFVTVYVVCLYALMMPGGGKVIELRILDTFIGATLAFIANYFLWPGWEKQSAGNFIKKAVDSNRLYLQEITELYNSKAEVSTNYRLARKNAFIDTGNLMASFQRMAQEPKSQQKGLQTIYKLVELNHSLLSAIASLGTYIQTHHTTKASEAFNVVANTISRNLERAIAVLDHTPMPLPEEISENLETRFSELRKLREKELQDEQDFILKMQEAQLVLEQLVWMISLSEGILKSVRKLEEQPEPDQDKK
jgi:uncharacterized membrane protein (TIGR01666 family)